MHLKLHFFTLMCILILSSCDFSNNQDSKNDGKEMDVAEAEAKSNLKFGLDVSDYHLVQRELKWGESFASIMQDHGIHGRHIDQVVKATKGIIEYQKFNTGLPYTVFLSKDSIRSPEYFIYHPPRDTTYSIIRLKDSIYAKKIERKVEEMERESVGVIKSSLDQTIMDNDLPYALSNALESVYAWTIDFFHLHKGDRFKVIYTEKVLEDSISIGVTNIKAAYFEHKGVPLYAFRYIQDKEKGFIEYFDDKGKNLRRQFLSAPLKRGRITSRYNLKRRIAYYGYRVRPHMGTDFAAPIGTPILSTANGTVDKVGRTSANGKYVRIKHNSIYSTQYLHMDKIIVKKGQFVKQGESIGTVGMTGNTSGPHVCYRFWKHGKQVDPFKEKLPEVEPLEESVKQRFLSEIESIKLELDQIPFAPTSIANPDQVLVSKSSEIQTYGAP